MATSAQRPPEMTLRIYAATNNNVVGPKPGSTANSGRTKHPAPTVLAVINNAAETTGPTDSIILTWGNDDADDGNPAGSFLG